MKDVVHPEGASNHDARRERGAELFLAAAGGGGQIDGRADDAVRFFGEPEREAHHNAGTRKNERWRMRDGSQAPHRHHFRISTRLGCKEMEAVERRHRDAHEVDEERKGARKNDEGEDVGAKENDRALENDKPEG